MLIHTKHILTQTHRYPRGYIYTKNTFVYAPNEEHSNNVFCLPISTKQRRKKVQTHARTHSHSHAKNRGIRARGIKGGGREEEYGKREGGGGRKEGSERRERGSVGGREKEGEDRGKEGERESWRKTDIQTDRMRNKRRQRRKMQLSECLEDSF